MPQTDELREEDYTRASYPDYTSGADDAEALLARYADLDRGYKGEHLSPETQAQAEELRRLQADAEAEGETVEHEAAETPQQEASEEDGYEEEGEVIPDDDMEGPVIPDGERLDSPQSLVAERAAAVGTGLEEAAKGASELTETQKLDAYIRKSVEDWAKSTGRDYEGLFAKSTPKQSRPAASPRPAPRTGAPAAETRVQTNGGQRRQDLEREASGYRNQGGGAPAPARPNPPVKPVEKPKVGRFDDGVPLVDTPPLGFYTPSGSKVPVKEPEYVDRRTADPRVSEGMSRSEATGWRAKGGAIAMGIPTAGVMAAPAVQLATGIGRTLKDAHEAGQSGARVGGAEALKPAQAPVRSGVRVGEGVVEGAARPVRTPKPTPPATSPSAPAALGSGRTAPGAASGNPQSQALARAPVEAVFVEDAPAAAVASGARQGLPAPARKALPSPRGGERVGEGTVQGAARPVRKQRALSKDAESRKQITEPLPNKGSDQPPRVNLSPKPAEKTGTRLPKGTRKELKKVSRFVGDGKKNK